MNHTVFKFDWIFCFQLSLSGNHIVDIKGISAALSLRVLDLSDNSIVAIEGNVICNPVLVWYTSTVVHVNCTIMYLHNCNEIQQLVS